MKVPLLTTFLYICFSSYSQEIDSTWIANTYMEGFVRDSGLNLREPQLIDNNGQKRSLTEFKGKILYIDIWTTWCVNCLANFQHSAKVLEILRSIHADTAIQFITICTEDSRSRWKSLITKYKPEGITLYTTDTSIYNDWHIEAFPSYIILDRYGRIIASKAPDPRDGILDYILYAAVQNIKPADAIWIEFRQQQYFRKNNSYTSDMEGIEYAKWFYSTNQIRYKQWQEEQKKKKSR